MLLQPAPACTAPCSRPHSLLVPHTLNCTCERPCCTTHQAQAAAAAGAEGAPGGALAATAAALGLFAVPVVAWSLYTLNATGASAPSITLPTSSSVELRGLFAVPVIAWSLCAPHATAASPPSRW